MAPKEETGSQLNEELASLRRQVAILQTLLSQPRLVEKAPASIPAKPAPEHSPPVEQPLETSLPELLDECPFGLALMDSSHRLIRVNKALCRMLDYQEEELTQLVLSGVAQEEDAGDCAHLVEQVLSGAIVYSQIEKRFLKRDKESLWVRLMVSAVRDKSGNPTHALAIIEDVTERKRTEEGLQQAIQKLKVWVEELERRANEMSLLSEMWSALRTCKTREQVYAAATGVARQVFPVQVGILYIMSATHPLAEAAAVWGDSSLAEPSFAPDECWALRRGRSHWVENTSTGTLCNHLHYPPPRRYLCVPMTAQNDTIGLLHLALGENQQLSEAKQRSAATMADHIAVALANLRLQETLRGQSIRDPLTGLLNRHVLEKILETEIRRATRNRWPLGLVIMEFDRFNLYSGTFGRDAADAVLCDLGALLQTVIRKEDSTCRFGEQKFCLVLPQGSIEVTQQRAENLRVTIRTLDTTYRNQPIGRITISAGIAVFPAHGHTFEDLIRAAEQALQCAKDQGGDRVVIAH